MKIVHLHCELHDWEPLYNRVLESIIQIPYEYCGCVLCGFYTEKQERRLRYMDAKEFSHLSKADLLELMLEMSKENDALKKRLKIYEKVVEDNRIQIEESGSIAEAALKINGVFEAAQAAADQYLDNIRRMESELHEELQKAKAENGAE